MSKFERCLIDICAPTLAGLKMGSLFCLSSQDGMDYHQTILYWDDVLSHKGVKVILLKNHRNGQLIYVYRSTAVAAMLRGNEISSFLKEYGYSRCTVIGDYIAVLRSRIQTETVFPHEIGLFLGYPLHDVIGFIKNAGKNFCCSGYWKVYRDQSTAEQYFEQYRMCTFIYKTLFNRGKTIVQLTVPQCQAISTPVK